MLEYIRYEPDYMRSGVGIMADMHEHEWHLAKSFETIKRIENLSTLVYVSTWVCPCGKVMRAEHVNG